MSTPGVWSDVPSSDDPQPTGICTGWLRETWVFPTVPSSREGQEFIGQYNPGCGRTFTPPAATGYRWLPGDKRATLCPGCLTGALAQRDQHYALAKDYNRQVCAVEGHKLAQGYCVRCGESDLLKVG